MKVKAEAGVSPRRDVQGSLRLSPRAHRTSGCRPLRAPGPPGSPPLVPPPLRPLLCGADKWRGWGLQAPALPPPPLSPPMKEFQLESPLQMGILQRLFPLPTPPLPIPPPPEITLLPSVFHKDCCSPFGCSGFSVSSLPHLLRRSEHRESSGPDVSSHLLDIPVTEEEEILSHLTGICPIDCNFPLFIITIIIFQCPVDSQDA